MCFAQPRGWRLTGRGWGCERLRSQDPILVKVNGYVLLTHDLDFGAILAASGANAPSVIQSVLKTSPPLILLPLSSGLEPV